MAHSLAVVVLMSCMFTIQPDGETTHGSCPDCGRTTRSVWGLVEDEDGARAVYYARWTDGHPERGAQLLVSIDGWGEGSDAADRVAFGIECQIVDGGPGFMLVDTASVPWGVHDGLGAKLTRGEALVHPYKPDVFAILDEVIV